LEPFKLDDFPHKELGTAISLDIPTWSVDPEQGRQFPDKDLEWKSMGVRLRQGVSAS
jgi:hypothetical protein